MDPRILMPVLMLVCFVAGGVIAARRMRTGWSPRRNQKMQRLLFYYALVMLGVFIVVQFYSGRSSWTSINAVRVHAYGRRQAGP